MAIHSKKLFDLFWSLNDHPFIFVEPGGNFGDYLIYKGAYKLAQLAGLNYKIMSHKELVDSDIEKDKVIYIHGGGGFNKYWTGEPVTELARASSNGNSVIIIGPTTFIEDDKFIESNVVGKINPNARTIIFTREMTSFNILKSRLPKDTQIVVDHDTALNLDNSDFDNLKLSNRYKLYAIRNDKEASNIKKVKPWTLWVDPVEVSENFDEWVKLHADAKMIVTNRTHSAILGNILGKETMLLPNDYHKNRSVWEYSLQARNVKWADNISNNEILERLSNMPIYREMLNSYKVNKVVQYLYGIK